MKQNYEQPTMRIIELQQTLSLLQHSREPYEPEEW